MAYNTPPHVTHYHIADYAQVMFHGLKLDSTMAGYFILLPLLLVLVTVWLPKLPFRKILLIYYGILALAISIAFIADLTLYAFWNFKLDATVLIYMDSPSNAMASVSMGFILLRVFFVLLLSAGLFWIFWKITPAVFSLTKWKIAGSVFLLLLGGVFFILIRGGITASTSNIGRVYYSDDQFLNHSAVNPVFSFMSSLGKTENFSEQFNFFPEEQRCELFDGLYPKGGETVTHLLKTSRPNVLIILMESFGGGFVGALGGNPEIAPNFNRLAEEGVFFTQCYSNSFRTDRGVICTLSGYPGLPTTSIMKMPVKSQQLPSIAKSLVKAGYKTDFLYGGDVDFTNMQSYLRSTGYQKIISDKDFSLKEQRTHAWGVTDGITFEYLYNTIVQRTDTPWHTAFLTLSSHDPFEVPYKRLDNKVENAFAYTDECLGQFIDKLKQTPAWDNLLVILLPDHGYAYPEGDTSHDLTFFHTPMLWLGGAVTKPERIATIINQTDLPAILLGQLQGVQGTSADEFFFSRNVFSSDFFYPFAIFSPKNEFGLLDSTGISMYDNISDRVILDNPAPNQQRIDRLKAILQTLYDDLGKK
ncbi:sulfatase [Bacteroidia bacterium]|nr:sulfatase [Bacteroidia bacterium]